MNKIINNKKRYFQSIEAILIVLLIFFGSFALSPNAAEAWFLDFDLFNPVISYNQLPTAENADPRRIFYPIPITAYSSEVGQTDTTPFTTASGATVHRGIVAANFLPIGARVRFPELFGDEVFIVEDRMNARYNKRVDIWMEETADAKNFGVHWTTVEVF